LVAYTTSAAAAMSSPLAKKQKTVMYIDVFGKMGSDFAREGLVPDDHDKDTIANKQGKSWLRWHCSG
jgi:hypothetical protein